MATALKLRSDIKKLKKALDTKGISASIKDKLKSQLAKAENELASMKKGKKPTVSSTGGTKTALTKLQSLIKKKKFGVYQGQGVDLKKDADRPALPTGKRKSKSGNTYYEYRANRIDVKQPPKRFPKLEDGGMMAEGGSADVVNAEISTIKTNIMGTISFVMKIKGMKKPQDFIVYPISADQAGKPIMIQSDTRIGLLDLSSGRGLMSQSHPNGAYAFHFQMDKKVPFKINETDLQKLKDNISGTAGSRVGSKGIVSDNSGANLMAGGGNVSKSYEKIEGTDYELKIQVYYDKGGMNYFTSRPEARGYYLSVSPVQVERRDNGIMVESYAAFSGIKALVLPVQRQSPKAEKQAEELAQKMMPELKEQVTSNLKRKLGMMAEGGTMEMRDVVTEEQQMAKGGQIDDLLAKQTEFLAQLTDIKLGADLETEEGVLNYRNQISPIREKLSVIEDELEMLGYEAYEKGGYMKKGGLTLGDISKKYDENEDINYHTENVVLLATHFGTADELRDAKTIKAKHDAIGHLPFNLYQERNELGDKLYKRMEEQIRENGMGAKPKKMAKGGYMAKGGEMHRYEKGGYMAGGGQTGRYQVIQDDKGYFEQGFYGVFDTKSKELIELFEFKKEADGYVKELNEKGISKADSSKFNGQLHKYEKGGYMAEGGKSQGYDDREDERLAMEHGKIADKDFVGTHSEMEHSRRDDAEFEERMAEGGVLEHGLKKGDHIMVIKGNMLGIKNEITGDVVTLNIETGERKETKE
jgi:hypothetical protein